MADHESLREELPLLAAGELAAEERARLERHLEECADCRAELEELRATLVLVAGPAAPEEDLSNFFQERIAPHLPGAAPRFSFKNFVRRLAALFLAFVLGYAVRAALPPREPPPAPLLTRRETGKEERLARAWRASAKGESGLSRALLGLSALSRERQ